MVAPSVRNVVALVALVALSGCMRHVPLSSERLTMTSPSVSFHERRTAFLAARPVGLEMTHVIHNDRMFGRHERWVDAMHLTDGTEVYSPEFLLSAIDPASPTAASTRRYDLHRRQSNRRMWLSRGFALAGLSVLGVALAVRNDDAQASLAYTGGGLLLGWGGTRFALRRSMRKRDQAEYEAYLTFDADLADYLDVCADGENVSDCR